MANISDVARHAGVSTATVSRYLRGQPVRMAQQVRAAIEELGYAPSAVARSLKSGVKQAVAVVVPDVSNPFFAGIVKGAESVTRQDSYHVFLYNTDEDSAREARLLTDLTRRVDGIILAPTTEQDRTPLEVRDAGMPVVFVDRTVGGGTDFDAVLVDNVGGARQATELLLGLGHQRVAAICGPLNTTPGRGRHEGFTAAMADADVEIDPSLVRIADFREEGGYQAALALLGLEHPPTAIFSANNLMTVGALKALADLRVRIPEEISVVGFDDLDLGSLLHPPLTVIDRPTVEQGVLAMRLLLKRLSGDNDPPRTITLETKLIVRGSTAPPPPHRATSARGRP